jgi:hypothetical protein
LVKPNQTQEVYEQEMRHYIDLGKVSDCGPLFSAIQDAMLGRGTTMLQTTKNAVLTDEENEENMKLGKEVAIQALSELEGGTTTVAVSNALSELIATADVAQTKSDPSLATTLENNLPIQTNCEATSVAATVAMAVSSSSSITLSTPSPSTQPSDQKLALDASVNSVSSINNDADIGVV